MAGLGRLVWIIAGVPQVYRDCYGQWVSAELVIKFHERDNRFPTNWQELESIYGDGTGLHHGGMSFAQVKERMIIEFGRLPELESLVSNTSSNVTVPEIIYAKSRLRSHWSGAEPNRMVHEYLSDTKRKRPNG